MSFLYFVFFTMDLRCDLSLVSSKNDAFTFQTRRSLSIPKQVPWMQKNWRINLEQKYGNIQYSLSLSLWYIKLEFPSLYLKNEYFIFIVICIVNHCLVPSCTSTVDLMYKVIKHMRCSVKSFIFNGDFSVFSMSWMKSCV